MALVVYGTRAELGKSNLVLTTATPGPPAYHLTPESLRQIAVTWAKQVTTSPEVHGGVVTGAVMERARHNVEILCWGATFAQLDGLVADVIECFNQFSWELHAQQDGADYVAWRCTVCDHATDLDEPWHFGRIQVVRFTLDRDPVPLVGAF